MKKIAVLVAFVAAVAGLSGLPSAGISYQVAAEPLSMVALMPVPTSLQIEAYDAI